MSFGIQDSSFINRIILPGNGRKYSGKNSKGLLWLCNSQGLYFPNHYIRKTSKSVILYSHGNGGSLGDFKSIVTFYATWFSMSVFAIEYPGYGPAEGEPSESTVNDNLFTAFNYLLQLGYPPKNIILMGYSIGTGPTIKLASTLCESDMSPGAVITIAAFLSICDIVRDLRGAMLVSWLAGAIDNRWASGDLVHKITCPILFIHGKLDDVIPSSHSEKLYENCSSEQKFIRICNDATHTHFHEPVDTIEPISMFIAEMLRPKDANILSPSPVHFLCPQSVLDRENGEQYANENKAVSSSFTEVSVQNTTSMKERSCVTSLLSWMGNLLSLETIAEDGSEQDDAIGNGDDDCDPITALNTTQNSGNSGSNSNTTNNNSNKYYGEVVLPGSDSSPSRSNNFNNPSSSASSSTPSNGVSKQQSQQMDAISEDLALVKAIGVLNSYYDALNQQDLFAAVAVLAEDVFVAFPEESRNWSGSSTAVSKFRHMFNTLPGFQGSLQILNCQREVDNSVTIFAHCHFQCSKTRYSADREMVYCVKDDKIFLIEHRA